MRISTLVISNTPRTFPIHFSHVRYSTPLIAMPPITTPLVGVKRLSSPDAAANSITNQQAITSEVSQMIVPSVAFCTSGIIHVHTARIKRIRYRIENAERAVRFFIVRTVTPTPVQNNCSAVPQLLLLCPCNESP